jgi:DNA-binding CsgD family transcriptional regulator/PAS domain-containing protein
MNPKSRVGKAGNGSLVDLVHGPLYGESTWQDFVDEAARLMPGGMAFLFHHDISGGAGAFSMSSLGDESMVRAYEDYYSTINPWMSHAAIRPLGKVVRSDSMLEFRELERTEFYNDYLRPIDVQTGIGVTIRRDSGCNFLFSVLGAWVEEAEAEAAIHSMQELVAHLQRAFDHYRRDPAWFHHGPLMENMADPPSVDGIVRVGLDMRVLFADRQAIRIAERVEDLSIGCFGKFDCTHPTLGSYIESELGAWRGGATPASSRVFHLRREGAPPIRVSVYRPGGGAAFFRGPECFLRLEDPADGIAEASEEFAALHGLSESERQIVAALATGATLADIAMANGTSISTVRTQIKHIFQKTGLGRQAELVRHVSFMAAAPRFGRTSPPDSNR